MDTSNAQRCRREVGSIPARIGESASNAPRFSCLALLLAAMGCLCACDDPPLELRKGDREVVVPDRYRNCSVDEDCVLVSTACDACCQRDAVAREQQEDFERDRKESCQGYSGPECDCAPLELRAICDGEHCAAVPLVVN
jgi:hypothetical protein